LRHRLVETDEFVTVTDRPAACSTRRHGAVSGGPTLAEDPRSPRPITDNAGGHAMASPSHRRDLLARGQDVIVHRLP
jgi:hypothetical protein